ncbi:pyridoxal-phosphate-dependent aminotransferase family protein [Helicobacter trogontum]|uniref:Alanine--glyoxylate aminotransferase family protein n=1 Tax=Helicobacter trogontum TaxID=50960 RepID=A0A4U8TGN8_9HELI|nr:alanine--glyoxylate aminotransferase family protein [Helicobacter trogontum]TLD99223.1 alanine--glyoxylate aminotransferase family protein [Helicobacter trogontum]
MKTNISKIVTQPLLFTPGPTPTPEFIRQAMAEPTLHHRTAEFEAIFAETRKHLNTMLGMSETLMFASSGTGAMEACIATFSSHKILSVNSGKFGERFGDIGRAIGREVVEIINEWDTPVSVESIEQALTKHKDIECVCLQICESAGGLSHPYKEVAELVKQYNKDIFVIADGITAMGVEHIDTTHIDALIGGSQKAFMLPPGLAFISLSKVATDFIENNSKGYYFNLSKELKNQRKNTTAYTAATSIIIGVKAYFDMLKSRNLEITDIYEYSVKIANATRKALQAIDLHIYPKTPANSMSVVDSVYAKDIIKTLKSYFGINVAGGQDRLKDKIFRINHMGYIPVHEIAFVVNAIELSLQMLNLRTFNGEVNRVFFEALM